MPSPALPSAISIPVPMPIPWQLPICRSTSYLLESGSQNSGIHHLNQYDAAIWYQIRQQTRIFTAHSPHIDRQFITYQPHTYAGMTIWYLLHIVITLLHNILRTRLSTAWASWSPETGEMANKDQYLVRVVPIGVTLSGSATIFGITAPEQSREAPEQVRRRRHRQRKYWPIDHISHTQWAKKKFEVSHGMVASFRRSIFQCAKLTDTSRLDRNQVEQWDSWYVVHLSSKPLLTCCNTNKH